MSQTYYDVEALESLLEERERDLELAARIGQTLLEKNRQLVEQVDTDRPCPLFTTIVHRLSHETYFIYLYRSESWSMLLGVHMKRTFN